MADSRPNTQQFTDIPITAFADWDRVADIRAILQTLEYGNFLTGAILTDAMRRDDRISGVLDTRVQAVLASPLEVKPGGNKRKAKKLAEIIGGNDDEPGRFDVMYPRSVLGQLLVWGRMLGIAVAEIVYERGAKEWRQSLKIWHPQFVWWDWSSRTYKLNTLDGIVELPDTSKHAHSDGKWIVFTPYGYHYAWLQGALRFLAMSYLGRQWGTRDWSRHNEKHGMPVDLVKVPFDANDPDKEAYFNDVTNRGSDSAVMVPQGASPEASYGLELLEAKARTWDTFRLKLERDDVNIAVALLGQNLTTEVQSGSRAAAQVQNQVRIDKRMSDAYELDNCIRQQALYWYTFYNFCASGDDPEELNPRPEHQVVPPEDETEEATSLKMLGDALQSLEQAAPELVDQRAILDRAGVPMHTEAEVAAAAAVKAEEDKARLEAAQTAMQQRQLPGKPAPGDEGQPKPSTEKPGQEQATLSGRQPVALVVERKTFAGLPIAIENPAGSIRKWYDSDGNETGATEMKNDYGFIEGHHGADGEELDCYLGPNEAAPMVHIVHQTKGPDHKRYDEDKVMIGFDSPDKALEAFKAHRNDGDRAVQGVSSIPMNRFMSKLKRRTSTGRITATALAALGRGDYTITPEEQAVLTVDAVDALMGLMEANAAASRAELADRSTKGRKRAAAYAKGVEKKAVRLAARSLASDLLTVRAAIKSSRNFAELRGKLVTAFRGMDPVKLSRIVEKARIMANLGGRLDVLKEI